MMRPAHDPLIGMMLAFDLPGYPPVAKRTKPASDIAHLQTETLRRHVALALSVDRFDASFDYQAELARRERNAEQPS